MRLVAVIGTILVLLSIGVVKAHAFQESEEPPPKTYELTVRTLPPTPGATFTLDGETLTADPDGVVRFIVAKPEGGGLDPGVFDRLTLDTPEVQLAPDVRAKFARWRGGTAGSARITAQFKYEYLVSFRMEDGSGASVSPDKIDEIILKSSIGEIRAISPTEQIWLLGTRIVPGRGSLDEKLVFWTVQSATDSGLQVVNRSETKFFPATDREVLMHMLYFSARFEVIDAFFGFRTGSALTIEAPNGDVSHVQLVDGVAQLDQVARGEYRVTVLGSGMKLSRPVAISRDQDVDLKLYTWLDLGLVALAGIAFLLFPVSLGIRVRRRREIERALGIERIANMGAVANQPAADATEAVDPNGFSTSHEEYQRKLEQAKADGISPW